MNKEQKAKIAALSRCKMLPGSNQQRFIKNLAFAADQAPDQALSDKQVLYLDQTVYMFRVQLHALSLRMDLGFKIPDSMPVPPPPPAPRQADLPLNLPRR